MRLRLVVLALLLAVTTCTSPIDTNEVPILEGLGDHHHGITVENEMAQVYFDQGLRLVYGFNHAEAIRSFEEAIRYDPNCAMCYWGLALAWGPNINAALEAEGEVIAYEAILRAQELSTGGSAKESAYIEALAPRYGAEGLANRAQRDSAYSRGMESVASQYPGDPDARVLYAASLMNLSPWNYWTGERLPRPGTTALLSELEAVLETEPDHAGACHYYIHAVEAAEPERAEPCADRLAGLMPGAGHIVHMPSHIYIRVGRWAEAVDHNHDATHVDETYVHDEGPSGTYPLAYYPHNYDMLSFAAAMAGRSAEALEGAHGTADVVDGTMLREPGLGALQHYLVSPLRVMVRFGLWEEILEEPQPPPDLPYPTGTWHFARGMAFASTHRVSEAREELELLRARAADPAIASVDVWEFNPASSLLEIAERILAGRIASVGGDPMSAEAELRAALLVETQLTYNEPPDWTIPVRHYLGDVLLESGKAEEAEAVFLDDLLQWDGNGFALRGLADALSAQGQHQEAQAVEVKLSEEWSSADIQLPASVF